MSEEKQTDGQIGKERQLLCRGFMVHVLSALKVARPIFLVWESRLMHGVCTVETFVGRSGEEQLSDGTG